MSTVKIVSGPGANAPAPQNYADIKGQGKIPYAEIKEEKESQEKSVKEI